MLPSPGRRRRRVAIALLIVAALVILTARFGGYLITSPDPLPRHADVAVVLGGGDMSTMARFGEGVRLLEQGRVENVMYLVPTIFRWGEWIPDVVQGYIAREVAEPFAGKIHLCEGLAANTIEEALVLQRCFHGRGWRSFIVVTSDFHTRRSRLIWRNVLDLEDPDARLVVHGVADGTYSVTGWWRHRTFAKTWLIEVTSLAWYFIESVYPGTWRLEA